MARSRRRPARTFFVVCAVASMTLLFEGACTIFDGLSPRVDAGTKCPDEPLPVAVAVPDAAPTGPDGDVSDFIVAVRSLAVTPRIAGGIIGFDLDGLCSCEVPRKVACVPSAIGAPTCNDGGGGIDNAAAQVAAAFDEKLTGFGYEGGFEGASNDNIRDGARGIVVEVSGYNGLPDDNAVEVEFHPSRGTADPPKFDGEDVWSIETIATNNHVENATVKDHVLVAPVRTLTIEPDTQLSFGSGAFRARIVRSGARWTFEDALLVGRVQAKALLTTIFHRAVGTGRFRTEICAIPPPAGDEWREFIRKTVCGAVDMAFDSQSDHRGAPCTALSAAAAISFTPARKGDGAPAFDSGTSCPPIEACP